MRDKNVDPVVEMIKMNLRAMRSEDHSNISGIFIGMDGGGSSHSSLLGFEEPKRFEDLDEGEIRKMMFGFND